ncbi:hypothetical protein ABZS76_22050 [Streptomyces sp. NPDC005562]|uniref:hypothetical protein n=1 Tax=Streptomyces sp. NPDC005562 TaxID=3154890 RepID=UPI0033B14732
MGGLLFSVTTAALMVLMAKCGQALLEPWAAAGGGAGAGAPGRSGLDALRARPFPWAAAVLGGLAVAGVLLQLSWSGAMEALDADPSESGWWRVFTSVFMQNGGVGGVLWNIATLAVVAALAHWYWGGGLTLLFFLSGILLPERIDDLLGIGGGTSTDPRNFAGSSGATYFLGATLAAALLLRTFTSSKGEGGSMADRLLAAAVPALGLAMWFTQENGHGLVAAYGFALGAGVWAVWRRRGESGTRAKTAETAERRPRTTSGC